jgi:hypothetical protein
MSLLAPLLVGLFLYLVFLAVMGRHVYATASWYNGLCLYYISMPLHLTLRIVYFAS